MDLISVRCPKCGTKLYLGTEVKGKCPKCKVKLTPELLASAPSPERSIEISWEEKESSPAERSNYEEESLQAYKAALRKWRIAFLICLGIYILFLTVGCLALPVLITLAVPASYYAPLILGEFYPQRYGEGVRNEHEAADEDLRIWNKILLISFGFYLISILFCLTTVPEFFQLTNSASFMPLLLGIFYPKKDGCGGNLLAVIILYIIYAVIYFFTLIVLFSHLGRE